jgi:phage portal protein BeeE
MNPLKAIRDWLKPKNEVNYIGRESFRTSNPGYDVHCDNDTFASAYPSIRPISDEAMQVVPFAVDENGQRLNVTPQALNALAHPNKTDSAVLFRKKLFTSILTNRNTYLLVWRKEGNRAVPGGDITKDNIIGYTFLEGYSIVLEDGVIKYKQGERVFTENEVMVFPGGVDGYNLNAGYSATTGALQWLKLDDFIADYNKGMFANGAIPAGQFIITAKSQTDYKDIKSNMQRMHKGAGNNNNVMYTYQPVGADGKPAQAQIQWIPFALNNRDMAIDIIFDQVNKRVDQAYGVPGVVKGHDESANYATAEVADRNFAKYTVKPLLTMLYSQLTHELNRITNGLGYAINYLYEIPAISDAEKVKAEVKTLNMGILTTMLDRGYELPNIVKAFSLPDNLNQLGEATIAEDDEVEVDTGDEVGNAPDQATMRSSERTNPKAAAKIKSDKQKMTEVAEQYMQALIDRAINELDETVQNAEQDDPQETFVDEMMIVAVAIMIDRGEIQYAEGKTILVKAGIDTSNLTEFVLNDAARDAYRNYLNDVAKSYRDDTAESIRKVLADAQEKGLSNAEIKKNLKGILNTDQWRVERLVNNELNKQGATGALESMKQIAAQTGVEFEKSLEHTGTPQCSWCKSEEGKWYAAETVIIPKDGHITDDDGNMLINKFADLTCGGLHVNCSGRTVYRIKE